MKENKYLGKDNPNQENESQKTDEDQVVKYKPVMVFYFDNRDLSFMEMMTKEAKKASSSLGYENMLCLFNDKSESRVEIISVDKATVVEDIQKYIDEKFLKNDK